VLTPGPLSYHPLYLYTLRYMDTRCSPQSTLYHRRPRCGGSVKDVVAVVIFLGLVGLGVWWVIKTMGQAGQQYTKGMVQARENATSVKCQMNMRSVWEMLQTSATVDGAYPQSRQELERLCGNSRLLRCPDPNGAPYVYLPPKRIDEASVQVVLYEPNAVHNGRCSVLLSNGQLGLIRSEELKAALAQMRQTGQ
jgi:hypothetical protein